jgi:hypothetical protein
MKTLVERLDELSSRANYLVEIEVANRSRLDSTVTDFSMQGLRRGPGPLRQAQRDHVSVGQ